MTLLNRTHTKTINYCCNQKNKGIQRVGLYNNIAISLGFIALIITAMKLFDFCGMQDDSTADFIVISVFVGQLILWGLRQDKLKRCQAFEAVEQYVSKNHPMNMKNIYDILVMMEEKKYYCPSKDEIESLAK
jgi:hypothetical protein